MSLTIFRPPLELQDVIRVPGEGVDGGRQVTLGPHQQVVLPLSELRHGDGDDTISKWLGKAGKRYRLPCFQCINLNIYWSTYIINGGGLLCGWYMGRAEENLNQGKLHIVGGGDKTL